MKILSKSIEVGGRTLSFEVGRLAQQATSSVLARYGDTMVLATCVVSPKDTQLDYFPLSVDYVERLYAGGRIKGSRWVKREGRPSDDAVLKGRLIDRSIRPLFDKRFKKDVQIIVTVLSVDGDNEPDILGLLATSAALAISPIPWKGPIGAVRVAYVLPQNGQSGFFANPTTKEVEFSEIDLVVSSTNKKVVMIEAGANEIDEDTIKKGILFAQEEIRKIIECINSLVKEAGQKKLEITSNTKREKLIEIIKKGYEKEIRKGILLRVSRERESDELTVLTETIAKKYENEYDKGDIIWAIEYMFRYFIREDVLKGKRADGRKTDEVRKLDADIGILPRTHGSAIFQRGETQALTVATLGAPSLEQLIEGPEGETVKSYMHHYSMPPYSVGETGRTGFLSRREIGHGALAERALLPVIPAQDVFPYTIRLVSEIMSSNGSTSMASTCGSTLALMDAGVPIRNPIAGISIGLVEEDDKNFALLTDIIGIEDFCGDMDFKIAGSNKGITAIQLDVKNEGLTEEIINQSFLKAKEARSLILAKMISVISTPRPSLSKYAPRVKIIKVPQDKIGEVIGPGGKMIRQIIAQTGSSVDVDDTGTVTICGTDPDSVLRATQWIENITKEVLPNEEYEGTVKRLLSFGAFVEILPGKEGMVHVSQMSVGFVKDPQSIVKIGDKIKVRVVNVDDQGRINLSMLFGEDALLKQDQHEKHDDKRFGQRGKDRQFRPKKY